MTALPGLIATDRNLIIKYVLFFPELETDQHRPIIALGLDLAQIMLSAEGGVFERSYITGLQISQFFQINMLINLIRYFSLPSTRFLGRQ